MRGLQGKQCLGESKEVRRGFSEALRIWGMMLTDLKFRGASEVIYGGKVESWGNYSPGMKTVGGLGFT